MPRFKGVNHVALATADMDMTIRFWRDFLGMPLAAGLGRPGARQYFFELAPGAYIAFFEWEGVLPLPEKDHGYPVKGPFAFDHLALEVDSDDGLWELKDRLEAADIWVSEIMDHGFIHSLYTFDPNGVPLEFSAATGALDLHNEPVMLDRDPGPAALEGPAPRPGRWPEPQAPTPLAERAVYPGEGAALVHPHGRKW